MRDKMEGSCQAPERFNPPGSCWVLDGTCGWWCPPWALSLDRHTDMSIVVAVVLPLNKSPGLPSGVGTYTFCVIYSQSTVRENQRSILTGLTMGKPQIHSLSREEGGCALGSLDPLQASPLPHPRSLLQKRVFPPGVYKPGEDSPSPCSVAAVIAPFASLSAPMGKVTTSSE